MTIGAASGGVLRRRLAARASALSLGSIFCVSIVLAGSVGADATRFVPWKDAPTPPLVLNDLAGSPHTLDDYRGRLVLLNFWATWCEPCRDEMASMQKLQAKLSGRPFVVLLVNYGEARARVANFVKREALGFPILLDPNQNAPWAWRVRVLPSSFLVDADGRVRYGVIGEIDWANVETATIVQELLR